MVDPGGEGHLGGFEGVIGGEVDGQEEDAALKVEWREISTTTHGFSPKNSVFGD